MRDGTSKTIDLTVGTYNASGKTLTADNDGDGSNGGPAKTGKLGLAVSNLDDQARQQLQIPGAVKGAVVQTVRPGSAAEDAGLQPGDVILEVNRQKTPTADQFVGVVKANPAGKDMLVLVWSKGNASYRTLRTDNQNG